MALDPIVSGTLNQMLGGNSFVERSDPKPSMWDHTSIPGMLGEVPMRMNWETGKMEPVDGPGGPVHGGWKDPFGGGFKQEIPNVGPIGTYKPDGGVDVAMEDWRKPYVKKWIRHHNPSDPFLIKDKDYLKNLQGIVLFNRPI